MIKGVLFVCLLVLLSLPVGCGKRTVEIDRSTQRAIDTLSAKEIRVLRPVLDSLCDVQFDSLVNAAMDSILAERRLEIEKILAE